MRWALGIEYDGTRYMGWQRLSHGASVQATVEKALSFVADESIDVVCSGRTDSGVHAHCQVIHFDTDVERPAQAWTLGGTSNLPRDIAVLWSQPVAGHFSARFDARARCYRYRLLNRGIRPALEANFVTWERFPLDADKMHRAAQVLIGEHDFSSFRAISCQARHPWRNIQAIDVWREGEYVNIEVQANAFLHHMVRNIAGSLLLVGKGEKPVEWITWLLAERNREVAGPTAPSSGLAFIGPSYPAEWGLPSQVSL